MGIRERKVENHLRDRVQEFGGDTRKWVNPMRKGAPDQIVFHDGRVFFVEVKTADGRLSPEQVREHTRLKKLGASVDTVYSNAGVDQWIHGVMLK